MSWSDEDSSWLSAFKNVSNNGFDDESTHDCPDDVFSNNETSTVDVEDFDNDSTPNFDDASHDGVDDEATHDFSADTFINYEASTDNLPDDALSDNETSLQLMPTAQLMTLMMLLLLLQLP
jgi:hypothetical protein